jgi:hypothetical protein
MKKRKYYYNTFFAVNVVEEAYNLFLAKLNQDTDAGKPYEMIVSIGNESWSFDTREEFLAEYPKYTARIHPLLSVFPRGGT